MIDCGEEEKMKEDWEEFSVCLFFLGVMILFLLSSCTSATRIVAVGERRATQPSPRVAAGYYAPLPPSQEEESSVVLQARAMGRKMAQHKRDRYRACVELRRLDPYADCVRTLGPVEMTCWGYGTGSFSCNPQ